MVGLPDGRTASIQSHVALEADGGGEHNGLKECSEVGLVASRQTLPTGKERKIDFELNHAVQPSSLSIRRSQISSALPTPLDRIRPRYEFIAPCALLDEFGGYTLRIRARRFF